jgi:hypothetical protein
MWCALSRWMISRAADTGKKPPRSVARHLERCGACGEYARFAASLKDRLDGERDAFLAAVPGFALNEAAWDAGPAPKTAPAALGWRFVLRPLPAAAGGLVVVVAAVLLFQLVLREPAPRPEDRAAGQAALKSIFAAPADLGGALTDAESSLEQERRVLEKSISSAAEYLQAQLNIRIVRKPPTKEL